MHHHLNRILAYYLILDIQVLQIKDKRTKLKLLNFKLMQSGVWLYDSYWANVLKWSGYWKIEYLSIHCTPDQSRLPRCEIPVSLVPRIKRLNPKRKKKKTEVEGTEQKLLPRTFKEPRRPQKKNFDIFLFVINVCVLFYSSLVSRPLWQPPAPQPLSLSLCWTFSCFWAQKLCGIIFVRLFGHVKLTFWLFR